MFEDIVKVHRQIYYEDERQKNNYRKQDSYSSPFMENGFAIVENYTPNLDMENSKAVENPTTHAPNWNTYEKDKTQENTLETFSDELEFYARRYGGGLR